MRSAPSSSPLAAVRQPVNARAGRRPAKCRGGRTHQCRATARIRRALSDPPGLAPPQLPVHRAHGLSPGGARLCPGSARSPRTPRTLLKQLDVTQPGPPGISTRITVLAMRGLGRSGTRPVQHRPRPPENQPLRALPRTPDASFKLAGPLPVLREAESACAAAEGSRASWEWGFAYRRRLQDQSRAHGGTRPSARGRRR